MKVFWLPIARAKPCHILEKLADAGDVAGWPCPHDKFI
jgi:hypothetical protein